MLDRPAVLGKGVARIFLEQLQVLSREPAADWHQPIGHHLIKSRHGDAEIFRGLDAERPRAANERGRLLAVFRPLALFPHFGVAIVPIRNLFKIDPIEPRMDG